MDCIETGNIVRFQPGDNKDFGSVRAQYTLSLEVFNFTRYNVGFAERSGRKYHLNSHPSRNQSGRTNDSDRGIYFVKRETIPGEARSDILAIDLDENSSQFMRFSIEAYSPSAERAKITHLPEFNPGTLNVQEFVSEKDLKPGQSFYLRSLDLVITRLKRDFNSNEIDREIEDHPFSPRALKWRHERDFEEQSLPLSEQAVRAGLPDIKVKENGESVFICMMKLIGGGTHRLGEVFVRRVGFDNKLEVTTLKAVEDVRYLPGLYVYTNRSDVSLNMSGDSQILHLSDPAQFAQYGVFLSDAQARLPTASELDQRKIKNRMDEMEFEERTLQQKIDHLNQNTIRDNERHQQQLLELERKAEVSQAENENLRQELLISKQKLFNEERKEIRENQSQGWRAKAESLKTVGIILTALLTLVKIFTSIFSKTTVAV